MAKRLRIPALRLALLNWYAREGRGELPWRATRDPYRVLVSETMLQQTQVERVVPRYVAFLERFPTLVDLANAAPAEVLREWKGLGYNARALRLHRFARRVLDECGGVIPSNVQRLKDLPGMGPYTVGALRAFAFEADAVACDTNVRRVVHRVLFGIEVPAKVSTRELDARALSLIPKRRAHAWNSAMMDLGATICTARRPKCERCPMRAFCAAYPVDGTQLEGLKRASRATKGSVPFRETRRFLRGRVVDRLRELPSGASVSLPSLRASVVAEVGRDPSDFDAVVAALVCEGIAERTPEGVRLPHHPFGAKEPTRQADARSSPFESP